MMLKKKYKLLIAGAVVLILAISMTAFLFLRPEPYNKNPDLSQKKMSSYIDMVERDELLAIEDLVGGANVILIGQVINDDTTGSFSMYGENAAMDQKMQQMGLDPMIACTYAEVSVERVLAGETPPEETITLFQVGIGEQGQPKVHNGERVVLILQKFVNDTYKCSSESSSVFYLDEQDKLLSMSSDMICARYDGLSLKTFQRDMENSYYYSVIGKSGEEQEAKREQFRNDTAAKRKRLLEWEDLTGKDLTYLLEE